MYHPCSNSNSGSSFNGNDLIISSSSSSYPIQPFITIESNPSSNSKDNNQLDQTNCDNNNNNNTLFPLPLPFPPPLPLTFFQFPYSPFEDNEIFLHHHHHNDVHDDLFLHHHHHQSLAAPPPNETSNSGIVNMEVTITTATATASRTPTKNKVIPANTVKAHVHDDDDDQIRITRRRSSKRDRHSKIKTARGLRDRRMRLSLDVAKRFFGLQDMLGFDKASKTVEWLLNQAKSEIKQLARDHKNKNKNKNNNSHHLPSCYDNNNNNYCSTSIFGAKSASSTNSECIEEGVSSLDEVALSGNHHRQEGHNEDGEKVDVPTAKAKKRSRSSNRKNSSRKSVFNTIGKESREKARERARERTMEKKKKMMMTTMMMRTNANNNNNKQCNNNEEIVMMTNHSGLNRLGLWNPFERTVVEESQISNVMNHSSFDVLIDEPEPELEDRSSRAKDDNTNSNQQQLHLGNCCAEDDSFVIMNRWSPTMILNSLNNPGILQEHQFAEFQSMGKPWEDYNNHI